MRTIFLRFASLLTLLALLASPFYSSDSFTAASFDPQINTLPNGLRVIKASFVGRSQPLRSLAPIQPDPDAPSILRSLQDRLVLPKTQQAGTGKSDQSKIQTFYPSLSMPEPLANFEGVNNINGVLPPDTQGDIGYDPLTGVKYYVQWVNLSFQIWDVTDQASPASVYGPAAGNTLWAGTGTICELNNDGDPITLFDPLAQRWMMSQFALGFPDNFHQCIAVSATADPTGDWYLYDFLTSTTMMNDYPKFGVWPDGYYMTVNQFAGDNFAWGGAGVAVFQRDAMLKGQPALMIYIDLGEETQDYGGILPSDLDGPPPPEGSPNYFVEWDDSSWLKDSQDTVRIWEFHTDWANPANTTFGADGSYAPNFMIPTSDVDPNLCNYNLSCIPQPGTTIGLDALSDRLMYRLQYRNFGDYQTLLTNHTVDVDGNDLAGVHWFELRNEGAGWDLFQDGVFAPEDGENRWMASLAMDDSGNIGLGYSVSSSETYPSIRYTGRLADDPSGLMAQGETSIIIGSGYQEHPASRWGDYSMMAVDPLDGCTFWYTQEYIEFSGRALWQTRVASFKFPSCTSLPTGKLSGMVTDGVNPIKGAVVSADGVYSTLTDGLGQYTLTLPEGDYDVTASMYGYNSATVEDVSISENITTLQDFILSLAALHEVSGVVSDSITGWPLYAKINIFGYPYSPIFTDPVTGAYQVQLAEGPYDFNVQAMSAGYSRSFSSIIVTDHAVQNFTLDPDLLSCTAPGYVYTSPSYREDFEAWPPANWTIVDNVTNGGVIWNSSEVYSGSNFTGGAGLAAEANSDEFPDVKYDTELISPLLDPADLDNLNLVYKANFQIWSGKELLDLDISTDDGTTWTNILSWDGSHGVIFGTPGETVGVDLSPYTTTDPFQLRWHYYTKESKPWDYYAQIDEVTLGSSCEPTASGGLVLGSVYDANTGLVIENPLISDEALKQAILLDTSADSSQANPLYIIGEAAGTVALTASANRYATETLDVEVPEGGSVRQDFFLDAGLLSANPASLAFYAGIPQPVVSQALTLANQGGADAAYEVFALPGEWAGYASSGLLAPNTRHIGPKNLNDPDASKLRVDTTPLEVAALDAGEVIASWETGLDASWGIGFNHDLTDLWIGSPFSFGGDDLNYQFNLDGEATGNLIDTSAWISLWAADMTYNPFTHKLWQVNVGGDNCIYEMDPVSLLSTGDKICPAFGTSERGLAFDPLTNTYFAGSWNDGIINRFAPDGSLLESVAVGLSTSGLAYNPSTGHLFVLTNHAMSIDLFDIYVLDVMDSYNILGGFNLADESANVYLDYSQAGLELDCAGNLWAVDQDANKVYVAESGETGVCDWSASWLSAVPVAGSVLTQGSNELTITVDSSDLVPGAYLAYLRLVSDTPYEDIIVPVTLNVTTPLFLPLVTK